MPFPIGRAKGDVFIYDKEKHQMILFEMLEPDDIWHYSNVFAWNQITDHLMTVFVLLSSVDWLTDSALTQSCLKSQYEAVSESPE